MSLHLQFWLRGLCVGSAFAMVACAGNPAGDRGLGRPDYSLDERLQRADIAFREARLSDAERLYRDISDEHPSMTEVWLRLGSIYTRQNALEAAVRAYEMALRNDRDEGRAWYNLSIVYLKQSLATLELSLSELPKDSPYRASIEAQYASLAGRIGSEGNAGARP